jgi:hypothetical protein
VDLDVTVGAIGVLRVLIMLRAGRLFGPDPMLYAVAREAELPNPAGDQQTRISRAVRRMAGDAPFSLYRRMFINKRPLFIGMALDARCIRPGSQSCLFEFKTAVRIMAIPATHRSFKNFVMKGLIELVLNFTVATQAKLWIADSQQFHGPKTRLLGVRCAHESIRRGDVSPGRGGVGCVAVSAPDVVSPMFSTPEVVVLFSACMATKARLRDIFRWLAFEGNDLLGIALFGVSLAGTMARFTTSSFCLPTAYG